MVKVAALVATGVNAEGYREVLGRQLSTSEDGAGWLAFWRDWAARPDRGRAGHLHSGLVAAVGATGASWQRCRTP